MADLNKVFLMGNLTFDPELRRTTSGTAVSELRLVTSRNWMSRDGERREEKLFIDVTVWDRQAEVCCEHLRKGSAIHVEGSLKMDTWDDKSTGEKRSKIRVQAERVQFLDSRRADSADAMNGCADFEAGPAARDSGPGAARPRRVEAPARHREQRRIIRAIPAAAAWAKRLRDQPTRTKPRTFRSDVFGRNVRTPLRAARPPHSLLRTDEHLGESGCSGYKRRVRRAYRAFTQTGIGRVLSLTCGRPRTTPGVSQENRDFHGQDN